MPTCILLVRHAQTAASTVFNGAESDVELSERGVRQVRALPAILRDWGVEILVSSAMRRTIATALPCADALGMPLQVEPQLHERRVGDLSGTPLHPEGLMWIETIKRWTSGDLGFTTPGAESFIDLQCRLLPVFDRLAAAAGDKRVAVVCHGVVIRVLLLSRAVGLSPANWRDIGSIKNLSLSELILDGSDWLAARVGELPESVNSIE